MNDEPKTSALSKSLDKRFARFPEMYQRMQRIADQLEQSIEQGMSADEAEQIAIAQINELGKAWLTDWAPAQHDRSVAAVQKELPSAIKQQKKTEVVHNLWLGPDRRAGAVGRTMRARAAALVFQGAD